MHTLKKLTERFWYLPPVSETDRPILGAVVGDTYTLMIDSGNSEAHAAYFLEELHKHEVPLPRLAMITHWHWDHIFGLSALNFPSISSYKTKQAIEKLLSYSWSDEALDERVRTGLEIEFCADAIKAEFKDNRNISITIPEITFIHQLEIDLGGVTCILQHIGGDHSPDSVIVYIKEEKILFLGDCIYPDIYSKNRKYTVETTLQLLDKLETFDAETFILSHSPEPLTKDEFNQETRLLRSAADYTLEFGGNLEKIQKAFGRPLSEDEQETLEYFVNGYSD
ncbi:MBL fold metallo-hydrolase [Peribacillus deserti]|uniref:Zn-dependent hydrolase n=1 Tax=Peribacillus deserti TaxID=673318 RepID=A0A2N5M248_9BACI|nr:MBL fold metallo-hydrolase [Peribacillus deserti]PLT28454.1 Zn-dependent hydrolase [Peribacillus deserti]